MYPPVKTTERKSLPFASSSILFTTFFYSRYCNSSQSGVHEIHSRDDAPRLLRRGCATNDGGVLSSTNRTGASQTSETRAQTHHVPLVRHDWSTRYCSSLRPFVVEPTKTNFSWQRARERPVSSCRGGKWWKQLHLLPTRTGYSSLCLPDRGLLTGG
jgi:hypothetical protein